LLLGRDRRDLLAALPTVLNDVALQALQLRVPEVHVAAPLLDYIQARVAHTRTQFSGQGLSPRAAIGLLRAARAWALVAGRDAVTPEHVQAVLPAVVEHRVASADGGGTIAARLLEAVPIP
jgi:MoxR-like ATPase